MGSLIAEVHLREPAKLSHLEGPNYSTLFFPWIVYFGLLLCIFPIFIST